MPGERKPKKTVLETPARAHHMPPLNWLRAFEAAARVGSFTAAADDLGLTQAAVSYQVRSLEKFLGFPLFERLAHGVRITDMGKAYLPSLQKAFGEISAATVGLFGAGGEVSLTVRTPPSFAALWLAPRLSDFRKAYPNIPLKLYSAIWGTAIAADSVDVEIRVGIGHWPGFVAQRMDDGPVIAVGKRDSNLIDGQPLGIADIANDTFIEIMEVDDAWTRMFNAAGLPGPKRSRIVRVDSSLVALELAAAGVGHALVLKLFASPYLQSGRLCDLLGVQRSPRMSHYLLSAIDGREKPEARLFVEWVRSQMSEAEPSRL